MLLLSIENLIRSDSHRDKFFPPTQEAHMGDIIMATIFLVIVAATIYAVETDKKRW